MSLGNGLTRFREECHGLYGLAEKLRGLVDTITELNKQHTIIISEERRDLCLETCICFEDALSEIEDQQQLIKESIWKVFDQISKAISLNIMDQLLPLTPTQCSKALNVFTSLKNDLEYYHYRLKTFLLRLFILHLHDLEGDTYDDCIKIPLKLKHSVGMIEFFFCTTLTDVNSKIN